MWEESWGGFGCCLSDGCCLSGRLMMARLHQCRHRLPGCYTGLSGLLSCCWAPCGCWCVPIRGLRLVRLQLRETRANGRRGRLSLDKASAAGPCTAVAVCQAGV